MNYQPSIKPITCPKCGKILSKPSEMGEVQVQCDACKLKYLVRAKIEWDYWRKEDATKIEG